MFVAVAAFSFMDALLKLVVKNQSIGQAGECVMGCMETQLFFRFVLAGDVAQGTGQVAFAIDIDGAGTDGCRDATAIAMQAAGLEFLWGFLAQFNGLESRQHLLAQIGHQQLIHAQTCQLVFVMAEHAGHALIDIDQLESTQHEHATLAVFHQQAEARFGALQGLFNDMAMLHVLHRAGKVGDCLSVFTGFFGLASHVDVDPALAAVAAHHARLEIGHVAISGHAGEQGDAVAGIRIEVGHVADLAADLLHVGITKHAQHDRIGRHHAAVLRCAEQANG